MTVEVKKLSGPALDWAVGTVLNGSREFTEIFGVKTLGHTITQLALDGVISPSAKWSQGGPLIERRRISVHLLYSGDSLHTWWSTTRIGPRRYRGSSGRTPLEAAMRALVRAEMGDWIELPEELSCP